MSRSTASCQSRSCSAYLQAPPFLGGSQTPRGTREQLDPVMPFQLAHHLADRAGRHSKLRSSGAHAALAQDDAKNIDRFE